MMVSKDFTFEASHILPRHPGKCSRLHGHSFKMTVEVYGPVDRGSQFVMDFADLSKLVDPLVEKLDHNHLNTMIVYPSSENIATYVAYLIWAAVKVTASASRMVVKVSETQKTWGVWDSDYAPDYDRLSQVNDPGCEWCNPTIPPQQYPANCKKLASGHLDSYTEYSIAAAVLGQ